MQTIRITNVPVLFTCSTELRQPLLWQCRCWAQFCRIMKQSKEYMERKLYGSFLDRSKRCAFVLEKDISDEDKVTEFGERIMDLYSRCDNENDVMSDKTTMSDEIEILLIRVLLRCKKKYGFFPKETQFIFENFEELYRQGKKALDRFSNFIGENGL
jgi:hypothetical protein